jgi:hypothetical protein
VSIVLFFLLSGFFLAALLGAVERSRKLLGVAGGCLVVLACIIVFLKPVQLPSLRQLRYGISTTTTLLSPRGQSATRTTGAAGTTGVTSTTGATGGATGRTGAAATDTTTAP